MRFSQIVQIDVTPRSSALGYVNPVTTTRRASILWQPDAWRLPVLAHRILAWVGARPLRRRVAVCLTVCAVMVGLPALVGAVAAAQQATLAASRLSTTGLDWTQVRDSSGVPLSHYSFVTSDGSVFRAFDTMLLVFVRLEFLGWWVLVTLCIWLIGWVIGFRWLQRTGAIFAGAAHSVTGQLAGTGITAAAVTVGSLVVAYFVVRGSYGKAIRQAVTMLVVAIFGGLFLAQPMSHLLGPHGALIVGRDLGVSVAAGLDGIPAGDPSRVVAALQTTLADNFARRPLQVWNFGHVIDDRGSCGAAWSAGMTAGDASLVRAGLNSCGDTDAYQAATDPQLLDILQRLSAGMLLLVCGLILVFFAVGLSIRIVWAATDSLYRVFLAILGFLAGGYLYGATQTFMIRNLVASVFAGLSMAAYTAFLGVYVLVLGDVFRVASGQVFAAVFIACLLEIVAVVQLRRLSTSMDRSGQWVVSQFAQVTQALARRPSGNVSAGPGVGSYALATLPAMSLLVAANTLNTNPVMAWLVGGGTSALSPLSRGRLLVDKQNVEIARNRWLVNTLQQAERHRDMGDFAIDYVDSTVAARQVGNFRTPIRIMHIINVLDQVGMNRSDMTGVLTANGFSDDDIRSAYVTLAAWSHHIHAVTAGFKPRVNVSAALKNYHASLRDHGRFSPFALGQLHQKAYSFVRHSPRPVRPTEQLRTSPFQRALDAALENPTVRPGEPGFANLEDLIAGPVWNNATSDDLRLAGYKIAMGFQQAVGVLVEDSDPINSREVQRWDYIASNFDELTDFLPGNPWQGPGAVVGRPPWARAVAVHQ